jgi:hypothetical protein
VYHECGPEIYCETTLLPFSTHVLTGLVVNELYQIRILFPAGLPSEGFVCVHSEDCTPQTWYADKDSDSFGDPDDFVLNCAQPPGYVANNLDCDDLDEDINPSALEICNGYDDNCDGLIDDDDPGIHGQSEWYADEDGDGFGTLNLITLACEQPDGFVDNADDCDDNNPYIYPTAEEVCNGFDDNCDGLIDDDDPFVEGQEEWYGDYDHDGYGDAAFIILSCEQPDGFVDNADDCDDSDSEINPGIDETCNGIDDNCDGLIDDDDPNVVGQSYWYADTDGDGYGDMNDFILSCEQPDDYVDNLEDCDDTTESVYPNAPEINDGLDNDCDDEVDEDHDLAVEIQEEPTYLIANASGSHPPFLFQWSTGETTQMVAKVSGEISVIVSDDYGYQAMDTIVITAIDEIVAPTFNIFPIPSNGLLFIETDQNLPVSTLIEIFDINGKTVFNKRIKNTTHIIKLDLSAPDILPGYYLLKIYLRNNIISTSFVLQKQ